MLRSTRLIQKYSTSPWRFFLAVHFCLLFGCFCANPAAAQVVTVEDGSGAGLLIQQGGNCYVILPTHLHGRRQDGIRLGSDRGTGPIGTAKIVHVVGGETDISLGLVRGGLAKDCGIDWHDLPRRLDAQLQPGTPVVLNRPRQRVVEGRRLLVESTGFRQMRLVPPVGDTGDLFGGTSGAVVFLGKQPIGMVLQSEDASVALALRMDEIVAQLSRFLGGPAPAATTSPAPATAKLPEGDPIAALSWSAHPIDGASDPTAMLAGEGPWVFDLSADPVTLDLQLKETDRFSIIRITAQEDAATAIPRLLSITSHASDDPARPRSADLPAPEMTPDGQFELRIGERFAKGITITIRSSWGGKSPVRIDNIFVD